MLTIGITGNIGSGKTTVCKIFSILGIPVYNADSAAKQLMNTDEELKSKLKNEFGEDIYEDNSLNTTLLAKKVFTEKNVLIALNNLVHPAVKNDFDLWMNKNNTSPYLIKEAAILFESGTYKDCDFTIVVTAPDDLRFNRVINRDKIPKEQVLARENNQMKQYEKQKLADFEIVNDEKQLIIPQVINLHEHFLTLLKK